MNILNFKNMRKFTTIVASLLFAVATFAQAPQGFSYQAVVRDAQNAIVANQTVDVTLTITAESDGVALQTYTEKHSVTTNANGLFTLVVGQGESEQKLSDIKWNLPNAIYNMRTETAYGTATTQLLSVPFAMYAEQAGELDYQKLLETLSSSDVQKLLGYVKAEDLDGIVKNNLINNYITKEYFENYIISGGNPDSIDFTVYAKNADVEATYAKKTDLNQYATMRNMKDTVDFYSVPKTSFYNYVRYMSDSLGYIRDAYAKKDDVRNFTTMSKVKDTVGFYYLPKTSFYNYVHHMSDSLDYIREAYAQKTDVAKTYVTKEAFDNYVLSGGQAESVDLTVYAKSADVEKTYAKKADIPSLSGYALKSDIPTMPTVPTKVSELQNDANYLTEHQDISGKQDVIADLADIRSGAALGATALQSHQDISGKQDVIADLETIRSGAALGATALQSHQDISGKQDVIADLETIRSGAALGATALQSHQSLAAYTKTADLADVAISGDYNDLTNKPTIPTVPTNVSAFTNDAAYVTLTQLQEQIAALQNQLTTLQNSIPTKLGDLDHTADLSVTVNYVINNDYPAEYNTPEDAWVIINGEKVTSTKTFSNLSTSADLVINGKFSAKTLPAGWSYHGYYEIFINGEKWEHLNKINWGITRNLGSEANLNSVYYKPAYVTSISDADKADYKVELIGKPTSTCTFNPNHYDYSSNIVTIPCEDLYKNGNCQIVINMYVTAYPTN